VECAPTELRKKVELRGGGNIPRRCQDGEKKGIGNHQPGRKEKSNSGSVNAEKGEKRVRKRARSWIQGVAEKTSFESDLGKRTKLTEGGESNVAPVLRGEVGGKDPLGGAKPQEGGGEAAKMG